MFARVWYVVVTGFWSVPSALFLLLIWPLKVNKHTETYVYTPPAVHLRVVTTILVKRWLALTDSYHYTH